MADDSNQELRIHIVSDADVKGFKDASAASSKLKIDTSDLSDETKRQLGLLPQLKNDLEKSGEAAAEAGLSHRELHKVFLDIGNVSAPGAGRAIGELAYGPVGAALALVGAFELLRKNIEDVEKQEDEINEHELTEHQKSIDDLQQSWINTKKALGDYFAALDTAGTEKDPTKKELENIRAITDAKLEAAKKEIEALGKIEIARLRANGASKEQIEDAQERQNLALAKIDSQKEYADGAGGLLAEQKTRAAQDARLKREANEAIVAAQKAKADAEENTTRLNNANEALDPTKPAGKALVKKREDAAAALESAYAIPETVSGMGVGPDIDNSEFRKKAIAEAEAAIASVAKETENLSGLQKQYLEKVGPLAEVEKRTQVKAESSKNVSVTNEARLRELPGEIEQAQKVQEAKDSGAAIVNKINERDAATGQTLGEMGVHAQLNQSQIIEIARRLISGQMTHAEEISRLKQLMAQADARTAALAHSH